MTNEELREKIKTTASADEAWHIIENEIEQRVDIANQSKDAALAAFTVECEAKLTDLKAKIANAAEIAKEQEEKAAQDISAITSERDAAIANVAQLEAHQAEIAKSLEASWIETTTVLIKHASEVSRNHTTLAQKSERDRASRKQQLLDEAAKL